MNKSHAHDGRLSPRVPSFRSPRLGHPIGDEAHTELEHLPADVALRYTGREAPGIGDLKLFEPKTMCPFIAVRDREEREPGLV